MAYRVFSGPRGAKMPTSLDKERMLYKQFDTLDSAFAWARHISGDGDRVALLIEGDDGAHFGKEEIVSALRHPESLARTSAQPAART